MGPTKMPNGAPDSNLCLPFAIVLLDTSNADQLLKGPSVEILKAAKVVIPIVTFIPSYDYNWHKDTFDATVACAQYNLPSKTIGIFVKGSSWEFFMYDKKSQVLTRPVPYGDAVKDKEQKVKKRRSVLLWLWLEIFDRGDTGQGACKHQEKVMNFMRSLDWKVETFRGFPDE